MLTPRLCTRFVVCRVLCLRRNTHWYFHASFVGLHFPVLPLRVSWEKGWTVRGTTTRLPYWADRLFYPSWNRSQLVGSSVADCQALT